jgi:hypothetical protein
VPPLRPLSKLDELGDSVRQVIKAYHGSPYDFDKFDARRIGSGEGASAFGHGLYFAGNEGTAKYYQDALGAHDPLIDQKIAELNRLRGEGVDPKISDAIENLRYEIMDLREAAKQRPGRMYEVEIAHPASSLLDWDAPISRQPKVIQKLFGEFAMDQPGDGGRIYRDIATRRGEEFDDDMTGLLSGRAAAEELLQEGIPGIRYLDGNSRSSGAGTRNYVMFPGTEDSIRILRKYGIAAPVAAGALSEDE